MSYRDEEYDREAHDVLFSNVFCLFPRMHENQLSETEQARLSSLNFTKEEMTLLEAYNTHYRNLLSSRSKIREIEIKINIQKKHIMNATKEILDETNNQLTEAAHRIMDKAKNAFESLKEEKKQEEEKILYCEKILAYLEEGKEMQGILNRFRNPGEDIQLTFASKYFDKTEKETYERHTSKEIDITTPKTEKVIVSEKTPRLFIMPIIIAITFLVSTADLPYGFYSFMRIAVPILSAIFLFFLYCELNEEFNLMLIPNILIIILWNPILPIYLDKDTWVIIDFIAAMVELIVSVYAYRIWKRNN
jgi:hypothetical protein